MSACENCSNGEEVSDSDAVSFRLLLPKYNKFSVHEYHYFISGLMLATTAWMAIFIITFLLGVIKIGG